MVGKKKIKRKRNSKLPKFQFSKLVFPLIILIAVVGVFFKMSEFKEIWVLFAHVKWIFILLAFGAQFLTLISLTKTYHSIFKLLKLPKVKFFTMMKLSATSLFLNFTIPAGGAAGDIWLFKKFRDHGANEGRALLSIFVEIICYYIAFFALLILAIGYSFYYLRDLDPSYKFIILAFAFVVIVLAYLVFRVFSNREAAHKKLMWLTHKIDRVEEKRSHKQRIHDLLEDFYKTFKWLKKHKFKLIIPSLFQFGKYLGDALTIYFLFMAFGSYATFMLCLVAFAFGRFLGVLSFMPGGIGAFEGGMVLILTSVFTLELSLAVMLVFRFFSYWLYIPLGIMFSRSWKVKNKKVTRHSAYTKRAREPLRGFKVSGAKKKTVGRKK